MNVSGMKRKALKDVTNLDLDGNLTQWKSDCPHNAIYSMPDLRNSVNNDINDQTLERDYQNMHPILP